MVGDDNEILCELGFDGGIPIFGGKGEIFFSHYNGGGIYFSALSCWGREIYSLASTDWSRMLLFGGEGSNS